MVVELVDVSDGGDGLRAEDLGDDVSRGGLHRRGEQPGSGVPVSRPQDSQSLTVVIRLCLLRTSAVWGPGGPGGDRPAPPGVQLYEFWPSGTAASCPVAWLWAIAPALGPVLKPHNEDSSPDEF